MTADGQFRDPVPPRRSWLDSLLSRVGGLALLATLAGAGLVVVALAVVFVGLLLPFVIGAGLIAFVTLWWRVRRIRRAGGTDPFRFVVVRR